MITKEYILDYLDYLLLTLQLPPLTPHQRQAWKMVNDNELFSHLQQFYQKLNITPFIANQYETNFLKNLKPQNDINNNFNFKILIYLYTFIILAVVAYFIIKNTVYSTNEATSNESFEDTASQENQYQTNIQNNNTSISNTIDYNQLSQRYISPSELVNYSKWELRIMRNEIFARHGYIFKSEDLRNYFSQQSWYTPRYTDVTHMLSKIEKQNIETIKSME